MKNIRCYCNYCQESTRHLRYHEKSVVGNAMLALMTAGISLLFDDDIIRECEECGNRYYE